MALVQQGASKRHNCHWLSLQTTLLCFLQLRKSNTSRVWLCSMLMIENLVARKSFIYCSKGDPHRSGIRSDCPGKSRSLENILLNCFNLATLISYLTDSLNIVSLSVLQAEAHKNKLFLKQAQKARVEHTYETCMKQNCSARQKEGKGGRGRQARSKARRFGRRLTRCVCISV